MPFTVIVSFVVVFAVVLVAVSVALKFFDARRKKQVVNMLHTAAGEITVRVTSLLKEIDSGKPTGFKRLVGSLEFSRHASEQIQQAGLNWSPSRLVAAMGLAMIPGLGIGLLFPVLLNGPTTAITLALGFGTLPYVFVKEAHEAPRNHGRAVSGGLGFPGAFHARRARFLHQ